MILEKVKVKRNSTALFLIPKADNSIDISSTIYEDEFTNRASIRLQLHPAIEAARRVGLQPKVLALRSQNPKYIDSLDSTRVCIVGKLKTSEKEQPGVTLANLATIARLKQRKIPIIVLYSDNNALSKSDCSCELYRDLLSLADYVVCPTKAIVNEAKKWIDKKSKCLVIEDPCQISMSDFPSLDKKEGCRLIWFGHKTNCFYLFRELPLMIRNCRIQHKTEFTIIGDNFCLKSVKKFLGDNLNLQNWSFRLIPWSNETFKTEIKRSHIALIPSDKQSNIKRFASHNRAVDALQGGCMVIANPIPSYIELQKCILLGDNFPELIDQGIEQYSRLTTKWDQYREELLYRFQPEENLSKWTKCIELAIT